MTYGSAEVLVVKLGGSLAGSTELAGWLRALEAAAMPVVIVPGGGPFAEAVRVAQPKIGFDDVAAHEMAMLGMTQFGVALASLCAKAVVASSEVNISAALAQGLLPVWSPGAMALAAAEIPASWDITSDSLAAWLAGRIGAGRLLLVKQVNAGGCEADLQAPATVDAGADLRESHISSILKIGRFLPPPCGEVGAKRRVGGAKGGYLARLSALLVQTAQKFRPWLPPPVALRAPASPPGGGRNVASCENEATQQDVCVLEGADRVGCNADSPDAIHPSAAKWVQIFKRIALHLTRSAPASTDSEPAAVAPIVDPAFGGFLARSGAQGWVAGPADLPGAAQALASGKVPGTAIRQTCRLS